MASKITKQYIFRFIDAGPGWSIRETIGRIAFPYNSDDNQITTLPSSVDSGVIGEIHFSFELNMTNYVTESPQPTITNSTFLEEIFVSGIGSPCLLDADGNGFVSAGDIDKIFTQYYNYTFSDVANEVSPSFAYTLDLDSDGVVTEDDFILAQEYIGIEGCVDPPPIDNYPMYLDEHPDDVAFAYSLRKLRSSFDKPCMSVILDIDSRPFGKASEKQEFFKSLSNLGPDFGSLPSAESGFYERLGDYQSGETTSVFGETFTNARDAWDYFKSLYPWLNTPLDIPFGPDGYIDHAKIKLLMDDPVAAYGVEMTPASKEFFNRIYAVDHRNDVGNYAESYRISFRDKCVVLIDRWYDQRVDEQRDMVAKITKGNLWGVHPFSKTSLMVGRFGKVMQKDGRMVIGNGTLTGIGDEAHLAPYNITEMYSGSDLNSSPLFHGISRPDPNDISTTGFGSAASGVWPFPNGEDQTGANNPLSLPGNNNVLINKEWPTYYLVTQKYNYSNEEPLQWNQSTGQWEGVPPTRTKTMHWHIGTAYLTQEQTNASYRNPHYEPDVSFWEKTYYQEQFEAGNSIIGGRTNPPATGDNGERFYTASKGERTVFGCWLPATSNKIAAIGATGAHNGIFEGVPTGYTDNPTPGYEEYLDYGSNPYGFPGYAFAPENNYSSYLPTNNPFGSSGYTNTNNPLVSLFRSDKFKVHSHDGFFSDTSYIVREDKRVPDTNNNISPGAVPSITSSYSKWFFYNIGNYRGFDLPSSPNVSGLNPDNGEPVSWSWTSSETTPNPKAYGNMMEFICWNDNLSLQDGKDYLEESKSYFENKKLPQ